LQAISAKYFPAAIQGQLTVDRAISMFESEANKLMSGKPRP